MSINRAAHSRTQQGFGKLNLGQNRAKITKTESLRRCEASNPFIFVLDDDWDLDGDVPWNPARFLNHSCRPNCEARRVDGWIWIVARRDIGAGEELTFNYGYDLPDFREQPCRCGALSSAQPG